MLYDLRTAAQWKILEGHDAPVSALRFSPGGQHLLSFSLGDSSLRVWKVTNTGFLNSFMGKQNKH